MASTIDDIYPVIRPVWMLNERLTYHAAQAGRLLYGLTIDPIGTRKIEGKSDMPLLQYIGVDEREDLSVGGGKNSKADVYSVSFRLAVDLDYGMFRLDPVTDASDKVGLMEWSALVRDAIQTAHDGSGEVDLSLNNTTIRPVLFETQDTAPEQLSWESTIIVELWTQLYYPGYRSCPRNSS